MRPLIPLSKTRRLETLIFRRDRLVIGALTFPTANLPSREIYKSINVSTTASSIHLIPLTAMGSNYERQGPSQAEGVYPEKYEITWQNTVHPQICVVCNKAMMR